MNATALDRRPPGWRRHAVFLDADGALLEPPPYVVDLAQVRLAAGAGKALAHLALHGFDLVVVGHRPGVAHGVHPITALRALESRLRGLLAPFGIPILAFQWCPHDPLGVMAGYAVSCTCRKPRPGLIQSAAARYGLDLADSWLVGTAEDEIQAGRLAGCRTIRLHAGRPAACSAGPFRHVDVDNLEQAARVIVDSPHAFDLREQPFF